MKKFFAILLTALLIAATGCSKAEPAVSPTPVANSETTFSSDTVVTSEAPSSAISDVIKSEAPAESQETVTSDDNLLKDKRGINPDEIVPDDAYKSAHAKFIYFDSFLELLKDISVSKNFTVNDVGYDEEMSYTQIWKSAATGEEYEMVFEKSGDYLASYDIWITNFSTQTLVDEFADLCKAITDIVDDFDAADVYDRLGFDNLTSVYEKMCFYEDYDDFSETYEKECSGKYWSFGIYVTNEYSEEDDDYTYIDKIDLYATHLLLGWEEDFES